MAGPKTNERPGVRASVRHARVSASKVREVLDLIRGEHVARALEILEFTDRGAAEVVLKCLESAIANARNNNGLDESELFVAACFADEGPTMKRWRPRARGRATRIRKRTCHITIIVDRMASEDLERLRTREEGGRGASGRAAAEARRRRVMRSREEKAARRAEVEAEHDHDHDHEHDHDEVEDEVETEAAAVAEAPEATAEAEATDDTAADEAEDDAGETDGKDD